MALCLITGGAGFIGSHLADALLAQGHRVRILDDMSSGNLANLPKTGVEFLQGSVVDPVAVQKAVENCEFVYHLAAVASVVKSVETPAMSHAVCATGTLNVLDAARQKGVRRVVYASSASVYGDQPGDMRSEDDALIPLSPYAAAKLSGEHYCTAFTTVYGLETVRLRFFNVFGPRQDAKSPYSGVIAIFSSAIKLGKTPTIFGDGLQARDFVYVADVVQAIRLAADVKGAVGRVYNVGCGKQTTLLDLVRNLNELLGAKIAPTHQPARAGDIRISQANIDRAKKELGFQPAFSFRDGLARLLSS